MLNVSQNGDNEWKRYFSPALIERTCSASRGTLTHLSTILNISLHRQQETKYNIDNMTWLNMQYIYMAVKTTYNYCILCHLHLQFSFSFTVYFSNAMHTASFAGSEGHSLHTCQHLCLTNCGDSYSVGFKTANQSIASADVNLSYAQNLTSFFPTHSLSNMHTTTNMQKYSHFSYTNSSNNWNLKWKRFQLYYITELIYSWHLIRYSVQVPSYTFSVPYLSFLFLADRSGIQCGLLLLWPSFRVCFVLSSQMLFCRPWL